MRNTVGRVGVRNVLGELGGKAGELGVRAHEVGLAGDLDERGKLAILGHEGADGTLVRGAAGLLRSGGKAVLAKDVDGLVHIALGLDERLLALHHGRVGHVAELFDLGGGDVCHRWFPSWTNSVE